MNKTTIETVDLTTIDAAAMLDSLPDGAYLTDIDRRIVFWNREAEQITGWSREEVVGKRCRDSVLCHIDKEGRLLCSSRYCPLYRAMATGVRSEEPKLVFARSRQGPYIPMEVSVAPLKDRTGKVIGGIEVFRDLSRTFEDLEQARIIQRDAVAFHDPQDPRLQVAIAYAPHQQVGGDFYQAKLIEDHLFVVLIADVMGHGISAALYTMLLRGLWDEGRDLLGEPGRFLNWLSRRMEAVSTPGSGYFTTAVQVAYDLETGAYTVAAAGHPPPFHVSRSAPVRELNVKGPALGLYGDPAFMECKGRLAPGDHLVLYTDGAFEVADPRGNELGSEGLAALVGDIDLSQGKEALQALEAAVLAHCAAVALPDDLTLISIGRT